MSHPALLDKPRFVDEIDGELAALRVARRSVRLLLGSDEEIRHERRVALVPRHVASLGRMLSGAGLEPEIRVLAGAGERCGFPDSDYADAGARIVARTELAALEDVDVVHALKEPTPSESLLPGSFLRLGAVHLASYPAGVCRLLGRRGFAAVFDGGTVGNCSYLEDGADRTPIVASMSRFAGSVSGRKLVEGLEAGGVGAGRIVVVGGGVAGLAAIEEVLPKLGQLIVIERHPPTQERLPALLRERGVESFEIRHDLVSEILDDAVGIVFAHRTGAKAAEKVCTYEQIRRMRKGAAVIDIAIDQGGSIAHAGYSEDDDATTARKKYRELLRDFYYYAETNMPREVPREASEHHGDASWVYVATLLGLVAVHGGPREATAALLERGVRICRAADSVPEPTLFDILTQDLRNGLQLVVDGVGGVDVTDPEIRKNAALVHWVEDCAHG